MVTKSKARKQGFKIRYSIEAGALPTFTIADSCTGSGKTCTALAAALMTLISKWDKLNGNYDEILKTRTREQYSGLSKNNSERPKLARVAICFVPTTLLSHWWRTAHSVIHGFKQLHPNVEIELTRSSPRNFSLLDVYNSNNPTIWLLPMESNSLRALTDHSEIGISVVVFDELNVPMKAKFEAQTSPVVFHYLTQATVESLKKATDGQPKHALRLAFGTNFRPPSEIKQHLGNGNYKLVDEALAHLCKIRQFAAPQFLRDMVSTGVQKYMPSGLNIHRVGFRVATLSAIGAGGNLIPVTLPAFTMNILPEGAPRSVKEWIRNEIKENKQYLANNLLSLIDEQQKSSQLRVQSAPAREQFVLLAAAQAYKRLYTRFDELFNGELPECPVENEEIDKENLCVMGCCTGIVNMKTIEKNICPLCKQDEEPSVFTQTNGTTVNTPTSMSPSIRNQESKNKRQKKMSDCEVKQLTKVYETRIEEISQQNMTATDGTIALIQNQIQLNSRSRILLCFSFQEHQRMLMRAFMRRITREIGQCIMYDIDSLVGSYSRAEEAKNKFDDPENYPDPCIFILNTRSGSSSVQGLDLHMTDLTLIAAKCELATQRQAVGRSLRMRPLPSDMSDNFIYPAKRLIVAYASAE
jgi:hypothetical protein